MELEGQVALISGGTRGIGRGIAEAFIAEGANVVINGRSADKGAQAIEEMNAGDQAHFIAGDVTSQEVCEGLVDQTVERYGKIDILVPNDGCKHITIIASSADCLIFYKLSPSLSTSV